MACGRPAIVSRSAGCARDLIDEGETGYTFEVGDVDALATCMQKLHERIQRQPHAFRSAVAAKIAQYDVRAAVTGTLRALESTRALLAQVI